MHVIYRKYNMPDSQLKAKGYLTAPMKDGNDGDVRERRQPDRLTPEKARTKKKRRTAATTRKVKKAKPQKKARLAADLVAEVEQKDANEESEEEEEDEWVDDEDEEWEENGEVEEAKPHQHICAHQSCARHDGKDALELFAQLKDAMGNASAPSGSTGANVMLGGMCVGQQLTAADVQLIVENQIEMARLGELARKYYLTQQLLNLLSKK
jgi:hypothetical protein